MSHSKTKRNLKVQSASGRDEPDDLDNKHQCDFHFYDVQAVDALASAVSYFEGDLSEQEEEDNFDFDFYRALRGEVAYFQASITNLS